MKEDHNKEHAGHGEHAGDEYSEEMRRAVKSLSAVITAIEQEVVEKYQARVDALERDALERETLERFQARLTALEQQTIEKFQSRIIALEQQALSALNEPQPLTGHQVHVSKELHQLFTSLDGPENELDAVGDYSRPPLPLPNKQ